MKKIILSVGYILFALVAVGVRIAELKVMIDPSHGFYFDQYNIIAITLSIIALVACVNFGIGAMVTLRKESKERSIPEESMIMGIVSLIMSLGVLADMGKSVLITNEYGWTDYLVFSLSIITALVFAVYGIFFFLGKRCPALLSFVPIIWSCATLIVNYTKLNGIALASEHIVDILTMSIFMVFWLYHSKAINHITPAKTLNKVFIFGCLAGVMGLVSTLPRFFVEYGFRADILSNYPIVSFSNISASLYVICFMGTLYLQHREKDIPANSFDKIEMVEDNQLFTTERPTFTVEAIEENSFISDDIDAIIENSLNLENDN